MAEGRQVGVGPAGAVDHLGGRRVSLRIEAGVAGHLGLEALRGRDHVHADLGEAFRRPGKCRDPSRKGPVDHVSATVPGYSQSKAGTNPGMDGETRPVDYAAINAVWISLAAALVAGTRGRASKDPITTKELIPLGAATFAVSKAVARERIGSWVREPFVEAEVD